MGLDGFRALGLIRVQNSLVSGSSKSDVDARSHRSS